MNECTQALSKNDNPLVVVFFRTIANSFSRHLQLSFFLYKMRTKKGIEFVRIGKYKYKANYKGVVVLPQRGKADVWPALGTPRSILRMNAESYIDPLRKQF